MSTIEILDGDSGADVTADYASEEYSRGENEHREATDGQPTARSSGPEQDTAGRASHHGEDGRDDGTQR